MRAIPGERLGHGRAACDATGQRLRATPGGNHEVGCSRGHLAVAGTAVSSRSSPLSDMSMTKNIASVQ